MRFRPLLRRLFRPVPFTDDTMPSEQSAAAPRDPVSAALDAAVAEHELAGAVERETYSSKLLKAIDEVFPMLDRRDKDSRH